MEDKRMYRLNPQKLISLLLTVLIVFACMSPAYAEANVSHTIVERSYPFYIGKTSEYCLDEEFSLYFIDSADDLPFVDVHDWAELLYFLNTQINSDPGYGLSIEYKNDVVTLERENGYTLDFDFGNN